MNTDRFITMVINRVIRVVVNRGVDLGIKGAVGMAQTKRGPKPVPATDMESDGRAHTVQHRAPSAAQKRQVKEAQRSAKSAMRLARKMGRF